MRNHSPFFFAFDIVVCAMARLISLDASTTTIGIAIIDYDDGYVPELIHYEFYKPNKKLEPLNLVIDAREYIVNLMIKHHVDEFAIEDYVRFMGGKSTAATIIPLAILNSALRLMARDNFGLNPNAIAVGRVRSTLRLRPGRVMKEDIPELVAEHLNISFPWYNKTNRKKEEVIMEESYDVADAIAVGLAYIKLRSRGKPLQAVKRKGKKKSKKK